MFKNVLSIVTSSSPRPIPHREGVSLSVPIPRLDVLRIHGHSVVWVLQDFEAEKLGRGDVVQHLAVFGGAGVKGCGRVVVDAPVVLFPRVETSAGSVWLCVVVPAALVHDRIKVTVKVESRDVVVVSKAWWRLVHPRGVLVHEILKKRVQRVFFHEVSKASSRSTARQPHLEKVGRILDRLERLLRTEPGVRVVHVVQQLGCLDSVRHDL